MVDLPFSPRVRQRWVRSVSRTRPFMSLRGCCLRVMGYGGVIGTMWSISDKLAPHVASGVFEQLFRDGTRPDYREAALALHRAVGRLRESAGLFTLHLRFFLSYLDGTCHSYGLFTSNRHVHFALIHMRTYPSSNSRIHDFLCVQISLDRDLRMARV